VRGGGQGGRHTAQCKEFIVAIAVHIRKKEIERRRGKEAGSGRTIARAFADRGVVWLGLACVGAAGALMETIADAKPELGPVYTLMAFIIVIVGGLGSMAGALVGGVLIGVSEALAGLVLAPSMKSMVSFALLILVLALRPQGLMGRRA